MVALGEPQSGSALARTFCRTHCPLGLARLAGRYLRHEASEADILHAWSFRSAVAAQAAGRGKPVVLTLTDLPEGRALKRLVRRLRSGRLLCTTPTPSMRRTLIDAGAAEGDISVLPPAADATADAPARRKSTRGKLGLSPDSALLVCPGPLTRDGGARKAVWVHGICRHAGCDVHLAIPRGGPFEPHVRYFAATAGVSDEIHFTRDELSEADVLAAADIAVVLSTSGPALSAAVGAMAAGLPVVATDRRDMRECVGHNRAGLLCAPGDVRSAAAAVLRLIEEQDLADRLGLTASSIARENYDRRQCRRQLKELYEHARAGTSP